MNIFLQISFASPNEDELIAIANAVSCGGVFHPIQIDTRIKYSPESLFRMLEPAIAVVLKKGIKVLVVTLGSNGVLLCSKGMSNFKKFGGFKSNKPHGFCRQLYEIINSICPPNRFFNASTADESTTLFAVHYPALSASVVRLTGAGDCLVGGALASICAGLDVMQSVAVGIAASKAAIEAETNVPTEYSLARIAGTFSSSFHV